MSLLPRISVPILSVVLALSFGCSASGAKRLACQTLRIWCQPSEDPPSLSPDSPPQPSPPRSATPRSEPRTPRTSAPPCTPSDSPSSTQIGWFVPRASPKPSTNSDSLRWPTLSTSGVRRVSLWSWNGTPEAPAVEAGGRFFPAARARMEFCRRPTSGNTCARSRISSACGRGASVAAVLFAFQERSDPDSSVGILTGRGWSRTSYRSSTTRNAGSRVSREYTTVSSAGTSGGRGSTGSTSSSRNYKLTSPPHGSQHL